MKAFITAGLFIAVLSTLALAGEPDLSKPQKEHEWLQQLTGEWETETEIVVEPGKPPQKMKGSESNRAIGGYWVHSEHKGTADGVPFTGILTLGYDAEKKKYVGTWIDSMTSILWHYQGVVDAAGKILTLDAEGPDMEHSGKTAKFRETIEVKSKDQKVFTSAIEKDGKWLTFLTSTYTRKK